VNPCEIAAQLAPLLRIQSREVTACDIPQEFRSAVYRASLVDARDLVLELDIGSLRRLSWPLGSIHVIRSHRSFQSCTREICLGAPPSVFIPPVTSMASMYTYQLPL